MGTLPILWIACFASLPGENNYLLGREAERLGKHADALAQYQACADSGGPLVPYAHVKAAISRARAGDFDGALAQLHAVITEEELGPWTLLAQTEAALLLAQRNRHTDAAPLFAYAVEQAPELWWLDRYRWAAADSAAQIPDARDQAYRYFRRVAETAPFRNIRLDAAARLARSPNVEDKIAAALVMLRAQNVGDAATIFAALQREKSRLAEVPDQWKTLTGAIEVAQGRQRQGLQTLRGVPDEFPQSPWAPVALLHFVRAAGNLGQTGDAVETCEMLAERYADAAEAAEACWRLAIILAEKGHIDHAAEHYTRFAAKYPGDSRADDALVRAAQLRRGQGRSAEALALYDRAVDRFPDGDLTPQGAYEAGLLLLRINDKESAADRFRAAARTGLGNFYGHRAQERLRELLGDERVEGRDLRVGPGTSFVRPLGSARRAPKDPFNDLRDDERVQRLAFFASNGLEEAEWEALGLVDTLRSDRDPFDYLLAMAEAGVAHSARQLAETLNWGKDEHGRPKNEFLTIQYPRAYWRYVAELGRETGVDPYLILAVARQESTFRPALTSSAGAKGVMQVMPSTAQWLAKVDPNVDPAVTRDLEHPVNSLRLGAYYLQRMIERSNGNLVYALAAYNAGPGNLDKWRQRFPNADLETFVESIPFDETRNYVKKVLGNYAAYHTLYPPAR